MQYDFSRQVRAIVERTKIRMDVVVRKFCFDMFADIMMASPVDTGAFRGNWMIATGAPAAVTDPNKTLAADAAALGAVTAGMAGIGKDVVGKTIYFTNNMPYAYRLEHGWSKQAPAGMVAVTVAAYQANLDKALGA
ncbi:HK97 gp10 family phage protein [Immundisolibacter sp.]